MRYAVPSRYLAEFALGGATYETAAAFDCGWIDEVADPDALLTDAVAIARELALLSPPAFAQTKLQLRQPVSERLAASGQATDHTVTEIWAAPETQAYIRAYVQRTLKK